MTVLTVEVLGEEKKYELVEPVTWYMTSIYTLARGWHRDANCAFCQSKVDFRFNVLIYHVRQRKPDFFGWQ